MTTSTSSTASSISSTVVSSTSSTASSRRQGAFTVYRPEVAADRFSVEPTHVRGLFQRIAFAPAPSITETDSRTAAAPSVAAADAVPAFNPPALTVTKQVILAITRDKFAPITPPARTASASSISAAAGAILSDPPRVVRRVQRFPAEQESSS